MRVDGHLDLLWCEECMGIFKQGRTEEGFDVDEHPADLEHTLTETGYVEW